MGTLSSLRRLATRALRHLDVLELPLRSALAHTATVARANISHQLLSYQKFRTWAAMVTHKLGDRDKWLTAAMCGALQLARTSQYRSMRRWRQESLDEVRTCMSRWLMDHQTFVLFRHWVRQGYAEVHARHRSDVACPAGRSMSMVTIRGTTSSTSRALWAASSSTRGNVGVGSSPRPIRPRACKAPRPNRRQRAPGTNYPPSRGRLPSLRNGTSRSTPLCTTAMPRNAGNRAGNGSPPPPPRVSRELPLDVGSCEWPRDQGH